MANQVNRLKEVPQTDNSIDIEGIVVAIDIEDKEMGSEPAIGGKVVIEVDGEKHEVNVFSAKYKKESREISANFKAYETIRDEYKPGDKVRIGLGNLTRNEYYGATGNLTGRPQINATFINRIKETDAFEPKAKFAIELFLSSNPVAETDKEGDETGRALLKGWIFGYTGFTGDKAHRRVFPVEFVVENDRAVDYVLSNYEKNHTVKVFGAVKSKEVVNREEIEVGFGEPEVKESRYTVTEFVVTGGSEPIEFDEEDELTKALNPKLVKKLFAERDKALENMKDKKDKKDSGSKNTGGKGRGKGFGDDKELKDPFSDDGKPIDISDDDLPF